jgi:uncharacterized protein
MLLTDELLLHYKRCPRRTFLNVYGHKREKEPEKDFLLKLRQESHNHTQAILGQYYPVYHQPQASEEDWEALSRETEALMRQGVDCIYHGKLHHASTDKIDFLASPTLLVKQAIPSRWGNWSYFPVSIQLGRRPKPEYKIIAGFNTYILAYIQGATPPYAEIILRGKNTYRVNLNLWIPLTQEVVEECLQMLRAKQEPEVFISRQRCSLCQWYGYCYAIAKSQQHLSLVPGITTSRYESLQKMGISSLQSLSNVAPERLDTLIELDIGLNLQQQAKSIVENIPILKSHNVPSIPSAPIELYFDIEAEPERNLDYLLGILLIDRTNNQQKYYTFLAKTPTEEQNIWLQFLNFVSIYTEYPIFHYSAYEVETIKRLGQLYHTPPPQIDALLSRLVDLHHQVLTSVILPIENYSLKSIAQWLGFNWRDPFSGQPLLNGTILTGDQCVCWYDRWLKTGDRTWLNCILRYNEDDCKATYYLKDWLVNYFNSH